MFFQPGHSSADIWSQPNYRLQAALNRWHRGLVVSHAHKNVCRTLMFPRGHRGWRRLYLTVQLYAQQHHTFTSTETKRPLFSFSLSLLTSFNTMTTGSSLIWKEPIMTGESTDSADETWIYILSLTKKGSISSYKKCALFLKVSFQLHSSGAFVFLCAHKAAENKSIVPGNQTMQWNGGELPPASSNTSRWAAAEAKRFYHETFQEHLQLAYLNLAQLQVIKLRFLH